MCFHTILLKGKYPQPLLQSLMKAKTDGTVCCTTGRMIRRCIAVFRSAQHIRIPRLHQHVHFVFCITSFRKPQITRTIRINIHMPQVIGCIKLVAFSGNGIPENSGTPAITVTGCARAFKKSCGKTPINTMKKAITYNGRSCKKGTSFTS